MVESGVDVKFRGPGRSRPRTYCARERYALHFRLGGPLEKRAGCENGNRLNARATVIATTRNPTRHCVERRENQSRALRPKIFISI